MVLTDSGSGPYDIINDVMTFSISEISNNDVSEMGRPIDFVFDSSVGWFSGRLGRRIEYTIRLDQIQQAAALHFGKFRMTISGMGYPIHFHELDSSFRGI